MTYRNINKYFRDDLSAHVDLIKESLDYSKEKIEQKTENRRLKKIFRLFVVFINLLKPTLLFNFAKSYLKYCSVILGSYW